MKAFFFNVYHLSLLNKAVLHFAPLIKVSWNLYVEAEGYLVTLLPQFVKSNATCSCEASKNLRKMVFEDAPKLLSVKLLKTC